MCSLLRSAGHNQTNIETWGGGAARIVLFSFWLNLGEGRHGLSSKFRKYLRQTILIFLRIMVLFGETDLEAIWIEITDFYKVFYSDHIFRGLISITNLPMSQPCADTLMESNCHHHGPGLSLYGNISIQCLLDGCANSETIGICRGCMGWQNSDVWAPHDLMRAHNKDIWNRIRHHWKNMNQNLKKTLGLGGRHWNKTLKKRWKTLKKRCRKTWKKLHRKRE